MDGCNQCLQYLLDIGKLEPEECYECGEKSARWIQGSDGTFGVKCKNCGSEAWADLNTPCELDENDYRISIMPFSAGKEELLFLSKVVKKSALETKKMLGSGELIISGNLREIFPTVFLLHEHHVSYSISPENPLEKYAYQPKCRYPYKIRE